MLRQSDPNNRRWFAWWLLFTGIGSLLDDSTAAGSAASFVQGFRHGLVVVAVAVAVYTMVAERRRVHT
jgi:hypothetical protein